MGDEGWLKRSRCEFRKFVYFSDVIRLSGEVTEKFIDDAGECCVRVRTSTINQRGEEVMPGFAIIALPSRTHDTAPVDIRLSG